MTTTCTTVRALAAPRTGTRPRRDARRPRPRRASPPPGASASASSSSSSSFFWSVPDGSNPLEGLFASASPVDGLGALTGYWYADVFAAMNVVLLVFLVAYTSSSSDEE